MTEIIFVIKLFFTFFSYLQEHRKETENKKEKYLMDESNLLHVFCLTIQSLREKTPIESKLAKKSEDWMELSLANDRASLEAVLQARHTEPLLNEHSGLYKSVPTLQSGKDQIPLPTKNNKDQN